MQTKLLRVLQDQSFERVGGSQTIRTNARLIAATNRDLAAAIEEKEFRSDLYYRLNVYTIYLPPLRDRGDDVLLLANYFAKRYATELKKEFAGFSEASLAALKTYSWPGNVRELQSSVKRALLETTGRVILPVSLQLGFHEFRTEQISQAAISSSSSPTDSALNFVELTNQALASGSEDIYREMISLVERQVIRTVMEYSQGNISLAARKLGMTRNTLRAKLAYLENSGSRHSAE